MSSRDTEGHMKASSEDDPLKRNRLLTDSLRPYLLSASNS